MNLIFNLDIMFDLNFRVVTHLQRKQEIRVPTLSPDKNFLLKTWNSNRQRNLSEPKSHDGKKLLNIHFKYFLYCYRLQLIM